MGIEMMRDGEWGSAGRRGWFLIGLMLLVLWGQEGSAQSVVQTDWQSKATLRLKEIYELGTFRPIRVQGEWLPDSSGFVTRTNNPDNQSSTEWLYETPSGKRTRWKEEQATPGEDRRGTSPDGRWRLSIQDHKLTAQPTAGGEDKLLASAPPDRSAD